MKSYFRREIDALAGYVPGEQPKMANLIKLNTNENPYPPSPRVQEALRSFDCASLRRYPDPTADKLRDAVAAGFNCRRDQVIMGNGSDDLLTMVFRAFTSPELPAAVFDPSYSLYPVLAAMQGSPVIRIPLTGADFSFPENAAELAGKANLLIVTRPNAPTGNCAPKDWVDSWCRNFDGMVLIDEAYADFAADSCMDLAEKYSNVMVMRTFSKGSSMAGCRLGYIISGSEVIDGLMKLKDSYNVDALTQYVGLVNFLDAEYRRQCVDKIISAREYLTRELTAMKFHVVPSQANFIFACPPDGAADEVFALLRGKAIIVRYFPGPLTGKFLRITVGLPEENDALLRTLKTRYN